MSSHWLKIGAVLSALSAAHSQGACLWWYESTAHGEAFRNAKDFGAVGDGVHDDTAAIQAALDYNQTGGAGSNLAKSPAVVYLPAGDYLISDTLVLWYYGHLLGNAVCPPTIRVAPSSRGFEGPALKPVIATAGGFNVSTASHAWWLQAPLEGGAANCLFYAHMRDLLIVVGPGNGGAVGILWDVAQQTSIRNVTVDLRLSGSIGIDEGGVGYAELPDGQSTGAGGGGTIEDVTILGGAYGLRIDASQYTYKTVNISGASQACVSAPSYAWTHVFVGATVAECPVAFDWLAGPGNLVLVDSVLGSGLGPAAIVLGGGSVNGAVLQNVQLLQSSAGNATAWVVQGLLPAAPGSASTSVPLWRSGPVWIDGVLDANASGALSLPSATSAASVGLPLACRSGGIPALCGGSSEDPSSGIPPITSRPDFIGADFKNAVTDFGAVGDGVHDDTAALQRALSRPGAYTFLPFGVYAVLATLQLGCNSTLVGEGLAMIALVANAPGFNDTTGPLHPLFSTSREAGCYAAVADVTLTTLGTGNDAALLLDHQAGPGSGFWDLHIRLYFRVGLKARFGPPVGEAAVMQGSGGGVVSNSWFWAADHNLTDMQGMGCGAPNCTSHRPVGQSLGEQITTQGPLFLVGTNFEHSGVREYDFSGAANVVTSHIQTEASIASLVLNSTSLVTVFGTLFGSGVGGGGANHTMTAVRALGPASRNCVPVVAGPGLDVSYRVLGDMQRHQPELLVDSAYTVPGDPAQWVHTSAYVNTC